MTAAIEPQPLTWGRAAYEYPGQHWGTGNRCGHDPVKGEFERYSAPSNKRKAPHVIQALLDGAAAYYQSPGLLPTLANLNGKANADGNPRCNRSEARAAESLVLSAIIARTEFASLRVGTPKPNGDFKHRSCAELAQIAGLTHPQRPNEPSQRFWRAFRRLKIAGAFTVHELYEQRSDGSKRARPAIKHLNLDFLLSLGKVGFQKLKTFRDRCTNQLKKARKKHREQYPQDYDAAQARRRLAMGGGGASAMQKKRRGPKDIPDVRDENELKREYSRRLNAYAGEIGRNNPGASVAEIGQLVRIKFPPFDDWLDAQRQ